MNGRFSPTIRTERLSLRPLTSDDARSLLAIFSDTEVMRYWNTPPWTSLQDALDFIDASNDAMAREDAITLGISLVESGALLGKCMLFHYEPTSRRAEIGFGIGRRYWGRGVIAEAGSALLDYGFETLKLRRIEAEIDPENVASARALERLGFIREGLLRQRWQIGGVVSDSALYGRLASDAPGRPTAGGPKPADV